MIDVLEKGQGSEKVLEEKGITNDANNNNVCNVASIDASTFCDIMSKCYVETSKATRPSSKKNLQQHMHSQTLR